jgi:phosphatidylserine/phosphatidylglycerophosphate/cardiolipin synthase-like enzyme
MKEYVSAVRQYRWVLDAVEQFLSAEPDGSIVDVSRLARGTSLSIGRPLSDQQILHALSALSSLGVLRERSTELTLDKTIFEASAERRATVRAVLDALPEVPSGRPDAELCVSLPPTIAVAAGIVIREMTSDLRAGLWDVISGARESLVIASPFWDTAVAQEVEAILETRMRNGLKCVILGRFSNAGERVALSTLARLTNYGEITIMSWFDGDEANRETFHFKAASADRGKLAYLGSANMIRSSLRSRMELGVLLRGRPAEELDAILSVVLSIAKPV